MTARPRLLVVTHYYPDHRGGVEVVAGYLARQLVARGWTVRWAASGVTPGGGVEPAVPLPMPAWNGVEDRVGVPYPLWSPTALRRLAEAVRAADVVHLHDALYQGNAVAFHLARLQRKPVVVTQHVGAIPYRNPALRALLWAANQSVGRYVLSNADQVVFVAPRVRDYFSRRIRFRTTPLFVPNGVDTDRFRPSANRAAVRDGLCLPADRPVLLFVGRFVEKKGVEVLRQVAAARPGWEFVFAGWGPHDPARWGLPNVRVAGAVLAEKLAPLYQAADLITLPSVGEGFPLVIQESMACGTPAVISEETAAGYPGADQWATAVAPTPDAVTAAVERLLADPVALNRRRSEVAALAHTDWDWGRCAAEYDSLLRAAVTRRDV